MRVKWGINIIGLWLLFAPHFCWGQFPGLQLLEGKKQAVIRYSSINNLILIKSQTKQDTLTFILDTGVKNTILFTRDIQGIKLDENRLVNIRGVSSEQEIQANIAYQLYLDFGSFEGTIPQVLIPILATNPITEHLGIEVDGIIGSDFFLNYQVKINPVRQKIYIGKDLEPPKNARQARLYLEEGKPHLFIHQTTDDSLAVLIDTGASHPLLLEMDSLQSHLPSHYIETEIGSSLGGILWGYQSRLPEIGLANYSIEGILVNFTTEYSFQELPTGKTRHGSIGMELLKRFTILFDYPHEKLYLKKNSYFSRKFRCNQSGINLVAKGPDLHIFYISSLVKDSPAEQAGLQTDDILLRIQGIDASEWELSSILALFESGSGKKISLEILRNQQKLSYEIILTRLL